MEPAELIQVSLRSLVTNKFRTILTTLGIVIGVFAVILLVSIGTGLQSYITSEISNLGSNLIFVIPGTERGSRSPGGIVANKLLLSDAKILEDRLENLANVGAVIQKSATVKYKNKSAKGVSVTGVTANYPQIVKTDIDKGRFFSLSQEKGGARVAIIGQTVIKNIFNGENPIGNKISVAEEKYTVIGISAKKGALFGMDQDNSIIVPITVAQRQFGITNVNTIYISAKKSSLLPLVEADARKILLKRLTEDDFNIQTQQSTLSTINNITNILSIALGGIAAISLLVGGIGIMNIMLVSVTERTKEIGLRKAIGAKRSDILSQFLLESILLSLTGGTIGIILGIGASLILSVFFVSQVTAWSVFIAFGFSVGVGIIFGMAPAIRASRLSPIEALRYE